MLLGGFWHGANWNFIIWGGMHGMALSLDKAKLYIAGKFKINTENLFLKILGIFMTFHFVCFCWIFFKASSLSDAQIMLHQLFFNFAAGTWNELFANYHNVIYIMAVGFVLHFIPFNWEEKTKIVLSKMPLAGYLVLGLLLIFLFVQIKTAEPIMPVYLQF